MNQVLIWSQKYQIQAVYHVRDSLAPNQTGASHAEFIVTDHGQIDLMEVAARSPGGFIKALYYLSQEVRHY